MTREEAIRRLKEYAQYSYGIWHDDEEDTKAFDMAIETLKAEPIKHGKWVEHDDGTILCECSECHEKYLLYEEHILGRNFCPGCGAKMDKEKEE